MPKFISFSPYTSDSPPPSNDLALLRRLPYGDYLKTKHWAKVRSHAIERADRRCQQCFSRDRLEVHHMTYERRGEERPTDLIVLCHDCHQRRHPKRVR